MKASRDTSAPARSAQVAAFRAMSPTERVRRAIEMSETARRVAEAGARARSSARSEHSAGPETRRLTVEA